MVIHPDVQIGPNCLIFQQVTIGAGPRRGVPRIGGHVDIGAGAKILGGIVIGDHAQIGANAVVVSDVPAGAVATGIPATCKPASALHLLDDEAHAATEPALPVFVRGGISSGARHSRH